MTTLSEYDCIKIEDDYYGYPSKFFCIEKHYEEDLSSVLIPNGLIQDRIERLAKSICDDMCKEPLSMLCVLKGGYRFFADLSNKIQLIARHSENSVPLSMEFIRLESYQDSATTGAVKVLGINDMSSLKGKNVLIVEDIVDTGLTMQKLLKLVNDHEPKSVRVTTLLVKRTPLSTGYRPDYIGFEVPNHYLVGYAFDYNQRFRDLSHICILSENGKKKYSVKHEDK